MNYGEILDLVYSFIDELDNDEQIIKIIKEAVNHAYLTIANDIDKKSALITIPYSKVIDLPEDSNTIIDISSGNKILSNRDYSIKADKIVMHTNKYNSLDLYYTLKANKLVLDSDVVNIDDRYIYNIVLYGAYAYAVHRKKVELANLLSKDMNELIKNNFVPMKLEQENVEYKPNQK